MNRRRFQGSKRKLSSSEHIEIAICYLSGIPISTISAKYEISRSGVHRALVRMGVETERGKRRGSAGS